MDTLDKNESWDPVELLVGRNIIGNKCLVKMFNAKGKMEKYKADLV